jgi:Zn-dependent protease
MSLEAVRNIILQLVALFTAVVFHEASHGYVADRLGDPTPRVRGRLTLNPLAHIDPIGSVLIPILLVVLRSPILFGWAKPVPISPNYFRNPFKGMLYVAVAGPTTNLILALLAAGVGRVLLLGVSVDLARGTSFGDNVLQALFILLGFFVVYNVVLAAFNMLPIPPLDGSRVLTYFLPPEGRRFMLRIERYGFFILLALIYLGGIRGLFRLIQGVWQGLLGVSWMRLLAGL